MAKLIHSYGEMVIAALVVLLVLTCNINISEMASETSETQISIMDEEINSNWSSVDSSDSDEVSATEGETYTETVDGIEWTATGLSDGTVSIEPSSTSDLAGSSVTIPDTISGYTVSTINSEAFKSCTLTSVTIPDSVTTVGKYAFYFATKLSSVTFEGDVVTIESHAFDRCINLTSITIPDSVTTIGDYAFYLCSKLTKIYMEASSSSGITLGTSWSYNATVVWND